MNPLQVVYSFPHRIGTAGIGTTAWHQVNGLVGMGADVHLYCGSCERPIPGLKSLHQTMVLGGLRIPYRALGTENAWIWHDMAVSRALKRMRGGVDIVHCWPLGALHTLKAAQDCKIKSVLERPNSHTSFAYEVVAAEHRKIGLPVSSSNTHAYSKRRLKREEAEYKLATRLACPSDFVAGTFLKKGFSPEQIVRHHYGYDQSQYTPTSSEKNGSANGTLTAAFVGKCEPRKGLHYALEAWQRSGAAESGHLLIAGTFADGYRELLDGRLKHPSVEILGFVQDPSSVMRRSDVFLLPSIEEGSALVTYEARACGCVLVVSDATGAPCEHQRDGLVHHAGNVDELTEHLRQLHESPELVATLRRNSLHGIGELSWQAAGRDLLALYRSLVGK